VGQSQAKAAAWLGLVTAFGKVSGAVCYETCSTNSTRRYEPLRPPCNLANVSRTSIDVRCALRGDWVVAGWVATTKRQMWGLTMVLTMVTTTLLSLESASAHGAGVLHNVVG